MATISKIPVNATTVSLAAGNLITARTQATWYPYLLRTPRVLVPIELSVLMVRDANQSWAVTGMSVPPQAQHASDGTPENVVTGDSLLPPLFTQMDAATVQTTRSPGAYLQWYLPRAFTSATADDPTNSLTFRPIPDRWLVVRISAGQTLLRRGIRGWVLEAGGQPPQSFDVTTWTEPGVKPNVQNSLTAMGHGNLAWAGYFDNVNGRLGFQDNTLVQDKVTGPIAYLVAGWFSDPTDDPLGAQNIGSYSAFNAAMQELGWTLDDSDADTAQSTATSYIQSAQAVGLQTLVNPSLAATSGINREPISATLLQWWPQGCLLHGAQVGITWPGNTDTVEAGGPPAASSVSVALGNTMAETMAAIVSTANAQPSEAQIVEALQLGVIQEMDQPDGRAELDVNVHTASFQSVSGGNPVQEPINIAPSGPPQAPPSNPPAPGPGIFGNQTGSSTGTTEVNKIGPILGEVERPIAQLQTTSGSAKNVLAETNLIQGHLSDVLLNTNAVPTTVPTDPGGTFSVDRAQPRFFSPNDPVVLIQGGKRAFTHDSTIQTENGDIVCRTIPVSELSWQMPQTTTRYSIRGEDILESSIDNGSVPPECDVLLRETALLDPGSASVIAATTESTLPSGTAATFNQQTAQQNIQVEQTAIYALRAPGIDPGPLLAHSGITGVLPAIFAISPPFRPWTPLELQWSGEFLPSPNGESDWTLDQIDYILGPKASIPAAGTGIAVQGRSTVTGGASQTLASAVANAIKAAAAVSGTGPVPQGGIEAHYSLMAQQLTGKYAAYSLIHQEAAPASVAGATSTAPAPDPSLTDISTALSQMDVLSCGLNGLLTQLRGGLPGDGKTQPSGGKTPNPFLAMRAGFLRIRRLRLIDGFGQYLDLCGSSATQDAQGLLISVPLQVPGQPTLAGLPPRFSAPTRAWFRYLSATDDQTEADYQTSPLCGFLMPNHLEGSLECFNADGSGAGSLIPVDPSSVIWQTAPGIATTAGQDPASGLTNSHAVQFAQEMIGWGLADAGQSREPILSALLRTIDSTLWTVDPFAHQGDEHLSLLLGHPVCIMRGLLRLDVNDTVLVPDNTVLSVPIRLGDLTQWVDGLLGYFVNDDYTTLHVGDASAPAMARQFGAGQGFLSQINLVPGFYQTFADDLTAIGGSTPVTHPYLDTSGVVWIRPNQNVYLTLLVEPLTSVHATMGLVPRKEIGMRREWVNAGLAAIAPTFRFGPVLVDPQHIRMPLAVDLNGTWVWDYRAAAATWAENPATNATDDALLSQTPATASEGWLKLEPPKPQSGSQ